MGLYRLIDLQKALKIGTIEMIEITQYNRLIFIITQSL